MLNKIFLLANRSIFLIQMTTNENAGKSTARITAKKANPGNWKIVTGLA